jgi:hypothetical protein
MAEAACRAEGAMSKDHNHGMKMPSGWCEPKVIATFDDRPEFLPVSRDRFIRASEIDSATVYGGSLNILSRSSGVYEARAPYFGAWLDRLGIPWTEELRRAHEAADAMRTKADPCQDAPGGGMICTLSRGHTLPHVGLWNGEIVRWNPPMHPDARAEGGAG